MIEIEMLSVVALLEDVPDSGVQYWLVAMGQAADTLDIWGFNNLGRTGAELSLNDGSSWIVPGTPR